MKLSEPATEALRTKFAGRVQMSGTSSRIEPLQDIIIVGAHLGGKGSEGPDHLSFFDQLRVNETFMLMIKSGIFLDPRFQVDVAGIEKDDFLDPAREYRADLVILCAIYDPGRERPERRARVGEFAVSPHFDANPDTAWHDSLVRSGAKVGFTQGVDTVIGPDFFDYPGSRFVRIPAARKYDSVLLLRDDIAPQFGL